MILSISLIEGSFQAGGVAGEYQVAERVKVTIVEKPLIIPHSLIEREVKRFFGVPWGTA